ncbi:hypothetical protein BLNAU_19668 [Blattamonas nauphoetae]|uniref:Uncharacterized protein n=1 Tax=Blattamonas nauphoetae TaxID=2049346 RepID=A0ABQ9X217_9EUKA|nr:hypothetical protein BLNAU_19668 [Blattamonas nauphoetae]
MKEEQEREHLQTSHQLLREPHHRLSVLNLLLQSPNHLLSLPLHNNPLRSGISISQRCLSSSITLVNVTSFFRTQTFSSTKRDVCTGSTSLFSFTSAFSSPSANLPFLPAFSKSAILGVRGRADPALPLPVFIILKLHLRLHFSLSLFLVLLFSFRSHAERTPPTKQTTPSSPFVPPLPPLAAAEAPDVLKAPPLLITPSPTPFTPLAPRPVLHPSRPSIAHQTRV